MDRRRAFTLVELLLVILILGVVVVIAVPNLTAVMGGTQSSASLRMLVQMGRYTRSMALLNQVPCELVVDLDRRTLTTEMVQRRGTVVVEPEDSDESGIHDARTTPTALYEAGATATISFGRATSTKERGESTRILARNRPAEESFEGDGDAGNLSDAIHMEQTIPGSAPIAFLGYSDTVEQNRFRALRASAGEETNGVFRILYRTNGTCRPYRIAVGTDDDDARAVVSVDSVGTPRIIRALQDSESERREGRRRW